MIDDVSVPLQVSFQELPLSPAATATIEERAERLSRFHDRITNCRVVVSSPHRHQRSGREFSVHIDLTVPGKEFVVNHDSTGKRSHEDVHAAIRDAFDAMQRQLTDHAERALAQRHAG